MNGRTTFAAGQPSLLRAINERSVLELIRSGGTHLAGSDRPPERPVEAHRLAGADRADRLRSGLRGGQVHRPQGPQCRALRAEPQGRLRGRDRRRAPVPAGCPGQHRGADHCPPRRAGDVAQLRRAGAPDRRAGPPRGRRRRAPLAGGDRGGGRQSWRPRSLAGPARARAQPSGLGPSGARGGDSRAARHVCQLRERRQPGRARRAGARPRPARADVRLPVDRHRRRHGAGARRQPLPRCRRGGR